MQRFAWGFKPTNLRQTGRPPKLPRAQESRDQKAAHIRFKGLLPVFLGPKCPQCADFSSRSGLSNAISSCPSLHRERIKFTQTVRCGLTLQEEHTRLLCNRAEYHGEKIFLCSVLSLLLRNDAS